MQEASSLIPACGDTVHIAVWQAHILCDNQPYSPKVASILVLNASWYAVQSVLLAYLNMAHCVVMCTVCAALFMFSVGAGCKRL